MLAVIRAKKMKKLFRIAIIMIIMVSCNESKQEGNGVTEISEKVIEEKIYWDLPNSETEIEVVNTVDKKDNRELFSKFKADLREGYFKIEKTELNSGMSYNDCNKNIILNIKGEGIRKYYIKRQKDKPKHYYPDFVLWVYEFENEEQAKEVENKIVAALKSGNRFCNGKSPEFITRNGNEVFQLSTRAEMFRGYISEYGKKLKNYR